MHFLIILGFKNERVFRKDFQIIKILRTFSKQDVKCFERFVHSPYFNASGVYFYRLEAGTFVVSKKIVLIK